MRGHGGARLLHDFSRRSACTCTCTGSQESNYPPAKPGALIGEPLKAARRGVIAPPSNSKPHSCVGAHEISMYYLVPRIQSHPPSPNEIWKAPTLPIVFCSRFHTRRHTPGNVKLLLPPRQSRGISLKGVREQAAIAVDGFRPLNTARSRLKLVA